MQYVKSRGSNWCSHCAEYQDEGTEMIRIVIYHSLEKPQSRFYSLNHFREWLQEPKQDFFLDKMPEKSLVRNIGT